MKVYKLIRLLQQCDPNAEAIFNAAFQGFEPITAVHRREAQGGIDGRMSIDKVSTVEMSNGNVPHMRSQGMDVIGEPEV
jgi:hypothetical protein